MTSFLTVLHEIHVMLVEHDAQDMVNTSRLLEMCQYKVTRVELASIAITKLLNEKTKFDVVMANVDSHDHYGFELLQQTVNMDIPIILMSDDDNGFEAMRAIKNGAFLYIQKPAKLEMLSCLWQHVYRNKRYTIEERGRLMAASYSNIEFRKMIHHSEDKLKSYGESSNMFLFKSEENIGVRKRKNVEKEFDLEKRRMTNSKRSVGLEWTLDLHEKFMAAAEQLGEGRCVPQRILELMDVPGLTRTQVKNHLQRCRDGTWKLPQERKYESQHKPRKYGLMPELGKTPSCPFQVHKTSIAQQGSQCYSRVEMRDDDGINDIGVQHVIKNTYPDNHCGSMVPNPNNAPQGTNSSNPWYPYDHDIFNFPEMDALFKDLSSLPQRFEGLNNTNPSSGGYHYNEKYTLPRIDIESQWSLEGSNFWNGDLQTRGIESSFGDNYQDKNIN